MAARILPVMVAFAHLTASRNIEFDGRIVNGQPTSATDYPFIVDLRTYYTIEGYDGGFVTSSWCTGSLIRLERPATILTAAHCLYNTTETIGVYLLRSDQDANYSSLNNYTFHFVANYTIHEEYNHTNTDNDIGLMFLDEDLTNNKRLSVVNITDQEGHSGECCANHDALQVIGYGADYSGGPATDTLEYTDKIYITRDECNQRFTHYYHFLYVCVNITGNATECEANYTLGDFAYNSDFPDTYNGYQGITENMICAIGDNTDSCQGDSGGPLIKTGSNVQVGVTSWGIGCAFGLPGVYTNLYRYREWLNEHANLSLDLSEETSAPPETTVIATDDTEGNNGNNGNNASRYQICTVYFVVLFAALYLVQNM
eukprot:CAMPEP_0197024834 /NCGR_PEP_ID=MMETSP1384-20130603/5318_1 /TAXON_ID=29189 /ORGANISM="Ammonia sp." /LENGTH=370 /DNA_ID=CAMNT_0042453289 /DNA_START=39 /DNA_END=1151 /DNA_ORIENTATION=+